MTQIKHFFIAAVVAVLAVAVPITAHSLARIGAATVFSLSLSGAALATNIGLSSECAIDKDDKGGWHSAIVGDDTGGWRCEVWRECIIRVTAAYSANPTAPRNPLWASRVSNLAKSICRELLLK